MCRGFEANRCFGCGILRVGNVDVSMLVGGVLEEIAVESGLLGGLCVKSVDLSPVVGARAVLVDHVADARLLAFGGFDGEDGNGGEETSDGGNRSFLNSKISVSKCPWCPSMAVLAGVATQSNRPGRARHEVYGFLVLRRTR